MFNELLKNVMNLGIITEDDVKRLTAIELMMLIIERINGLLNHVEIIDEKLVNLLENIRTNTIEELNNWKQNGTFDKLINQIALKKINDLLDETMVQLTNKANKNEVFTMANLGQDIREAMTGGSVPVVGKNSVLSENIVNGQVTVSKLDVGLLQLCGISENLVEMKWKQGSISGDNGSNSSATTRLFTDNYVTSENSITININEGFKFKCFQYSKESTSTYVRSSEWITESSYTINPDSSSFYRFVIAYEDDREIDVSKSKNINIYCKGSSILNEINELKQSINEKVTVDKLDEEVLQLFGIGEKLVEMEWKQGSISATNGSNSSGTTRLFTDNYMSSENEITIKINNGFKFKWFQYSEKSTSTYVGASEWITETSYTFKPDSSSFYRFIIAYEDDREIDVNKSNNINIYCKVSISNDINELKRSDVLSQESDLLMKFPVTYQSGSYAGDMCMVNDLLFCFNATDDEHVDFYKGSIYKINVKSKTYELYKRISHNFGHCNTIDYCSDTDTLIFGNGSGAFGQIGKAYIYQGFYKKVLESNDDTLSFDIEDCIELTGIDDLGEKYNVVWGEDNDGRFDIAYLITNNNNNFYRLQLAKNGNLFTGSVRVLKTFEYNTGEVPPSNTFCVQGADYHNGYLYVGIGHHKKWYWKFKINADTLALADEIKEQSYDENGEESKNQIQSICVNGDYLLLNLNHNVCVYRR